jgi:segregation and condensation protein B
MKLQQALEALIFAAPKPISAADLLAAVRAAAESSESEHAQAFRAVNEEGILEALILLQQDFEVEDRAFRLMEQATGWGFVTKPEYAPWVRKLYPETKPARLSGPALETLAIIAYRQPVTRADIEAVRGVAVDGVMAVLLDRSLVRIAGRAELPGRPLLYSTTGYFLEHFGLKSTQDLPNASELGRLNLPKAAVAEDKSGKRKDGKGGEAAEPELPLQAHPSPVKQPEPKSGVGALPASEAAPQAEAADGGQAVPDSTVSVEVREALPAAPAHEAHPDSAEPSSFRESSEPATESGEALRLGEVAFVQEASSEVYREGTAALSASTDAEAVGEEDFEEEIYTDPDYPVPQEPE